MNINKRISTLSFAIFNCIFPFLGSSPVYISELLTVDSELNLISTHLDSADNFNDLNHSYWFREASHQLLTEQHFFMINRLLTSGKTPFQEYYVVDTPSHGKILFIDGEVQSAQDDEFIYHESLVHPAMVAHPHPKRVLIIGAGEGAAAREVLKHPSVEKVVMIDIDGEIIQRTKEFLTEWHEGSFDHPKVELIIMDGKEYVDTTNEKFDLIYIDVCDKLDDIGPAAKFYCKEFYTSLKKILDQGGIVTVQAMEFDFGVAEDHLIVHRELEKSFDNVASYHVYVPSFWCSWGYAMATEGDHFNKLTSQNIDRVLEERGLEKKLKHYDGQTHLHMFSLPKSMRK